MGHIGVGGGHRVATRSAAGGRGTVPTMSEPGFRIFEQEWPEGDYRHMQLGFIVDDLFAAAERWTRVHGIGPFHVLPRWQTPYTYRGEPSVLTPRSRWRRPDRCRSS